MPLERPSIGLRASGVELREVHDVGNRAEPFGAAESVGAGEEIEILVDVDVLVGAEIVGHEAEPPPHAVRIVDDREAVDQRVARGGLVERGQDPHAGGFAGAVGADVAEDLAGGDFETRRRSRRACP